MLRNLLYFSGSIILFFVGIILYGIVLNLREDSLNEAMSEKGLTKLNNVHIIISRNNYTLDLYSDTILVKSYKAVFGQGKGKIKVSKEDNITPLGVYHICLIDTNSTFHKKLFLDYPNEKDAAETFKHGLIRKIDYDNIISAENSSGCPPDNTPLGSDIGIQGIGEYDFIFRNLPFVFNWTNGSIAVSNENIDEIYSVTGIDIRVEIRN